MSLCIAAVCNHEGQPRIITGHDWQQETAVAGAEIGDKMRWLVRPTWVSLFADKQGRAEQLLDTYKRVLQSGSFSGQRFELKTQTDVHRFLEKGLTDYKIRQCDEYLGLRYGITYAELLAGSTEGAKQLPQDFISRELEDMAKLSLDAQLIVAGFAEGKPCLFGVNESPFYDPANSVPVRPDMNFVAIGSGAPAAVMMLHLRKHEGIDTSLMRGIYNVYEALSFSLGLVPGVGHESMSIDVHKPDDPPQSLSDKAWNYLERRFVDFGPREISDKAKFTFKREYLEAFEFDWENSPTDKAK